MQGVERSDRELLDAAALVGHLVPAGSMFAFLAEHRRRVFPDEMFADLFPSGMGRASMPGSVAASILTLQTLLDLSDAETAEAARCDLRWKVACGGGVGRHRLSPVHVDVLAAAVGEVGASASHQRGGAQGGGGDGDLAAPAPSGGALHDCGRCGRHAGHQHAVGGGGAAGSAAGTGRGRADRRGVHGHDYSQPGKPSIDWDDPAAKDALVSALVSDANALVAALQDRDLDERAASALALLALVAGQDVEPAEGSDGTDGRWRIAREVAGDRVISTVDPDARHTRKSGEARRDGYRAHLAADPETGIITDEKMTRAAGTENSDPAVAEEFLAAETAAGGMAGSPGSPAAGGPDDGAAPGRDLSWYGDSAYGTGDLRGAICDAGHQAVIKPKPLQAPVQGGFT